MIGAVEKNRARKGLRVLGDKGHFILVQDGSGRLAERWCVSKDLKLNPKDPSLPETQLGTCRMPSCGQWQREAALRTTHKIPV